MEAPAATTSASAAHDEDPAKARGPAETFVNLVGGMVDQNDVQTIIAQQSLMLSRFEKTNEKLERFNSLESGRFSQAMEQFRSHTRVLTDMKKDLDAVFRRIRLLRGKLARQYPEMFEAYERDHATEEEENEGEDPEPSKEDDVSSHSLEDGTGPAADSAVSTAAASQQ